MSKESFDLSGAVSLVTGATGGIGRATVRALADMGSTVIATDLAEIAAIDGAAAYRRQDVTDETGWADLVAWIEREHGALHNLVNNAGLSVTNSIAATSLAEWRRCMAVNVEGPFLGTQAAADLLRRSGEGRPGGASIVNLSSVGGLQGAAYMATYCSSKGAIRLFTKSAAAEYAALGWPIRVNSVHPGGIETEMMHTIYQRYVDEGLFPDLETANRTVMGAHMLNRLGKPAEIAHGIAFLCSPGASFMTGAELVIDGGFTAS